MLVNEDIARRLFAAFQRAKARKADSFTFQGHELDVQYTFYMLQAIAAKFPALELDKKLVAYRKPLGE